MARYGGGMVEGGVLGAPMELGCAVLVPHGQAPDSLLTLVQLTG